MTVGHIALTSRLFEQAISDQLTRKLGSSPRTISTVDAIALEEQEIVGISHILTVMLPLAIELALKSLWECLHGSGAYPRKHDLSMLFQSLDVDVPDVARARSVKDQARSHWSAFQREGQLTFAGTLDDFLAAHADDFEQARYYTFRHRSLQINDLIACYACLVGPLAKRDQATLRNLAARLDLPDEATSNKG